MGIVAYKHPLNHSFKWIHKGTKPVDPRWNSFEQFVEDVGERPSDQHRLVKKDSSKPIGPDNFFWRENAFKDGRGKGYRERQAAYQRHYRRLYPRRAKHQDLAKLYGISIRDYEQMLEDQDHRCAICNLSESVEINGKSTRLAVDHCHESGEIRGLLCAKCNRGLGLFKDDPRILKRAIEYLNA